MSEQDKNNWANKLCESIEIFISDSKQIKFNTHRNRKQFVNKIIEMIKESISSNVPEQPSQTKTTGHNGLVITNPNPNKPVGYSVMDSGKSQLGDENFKSVTAKNSGFRQW